MAIVVGYVPTKEGRAALRRAADESLLRAVAAPFQPEGGLRLVHGNLGRGTIKLSAVDRARWTIEAPCRVFAEQNDVLRAFKAGELERDVVVVVRFQGPAANGMPELHKLTPPLGVLQNRGFKVALVTDGRMSGASGKVPCAIHCSPEALLDGAIGLIRDGSLRALAVTGPEPNPALPHVPTLAEASGLPGLAATVWFGLQVPRATPPETVARLNEAARLMLAEPATRARLAELGVEPMGGSPADFSLFIRAETAKWREITTAARIIVE